MARIIQILFLTLPSMPVFGQGICSKAKMLGTWEGVERAVYGTAKMDSLLTAAKELNVVKQAVSFTFQENGTYIDSDAVGFYYKGRRIYRYEGPYYFTEGQCEIRFGKRKHDQVWDILFVDERFMVIRYTNPKATFISVLRRTM